MIGAAGRSRSRLLDRSCVPRNGLEMTLQGWEWTSVELLHVGTVRMIENTDSARWIEPLIGALESSAGTSI